MASLSVFFVSQKSFSLTFFVIDPIEIVDNLVQLLQLICQLFHLKLRFQMKQMIICLSIRKDRMN